MYKARLLLATSVALVLGGCASSGVLTGAVPPAGGLGRFRTVSVKVESRVADTQEEAKSLGELIVAGLQKPGRWQVDDQDAELVLTATLTDIRKVPRAARLIGGALAGQASVDADVVLRDARGAELGRFHVTGKSSGGTIFAGTTDQALERAAEQVVAFIEQNGGT
jgi:hypothetical protein